MTKNKTIRVRYIRYHWDYAYTVGQIYDMPADQVERLLPDGHVEILPDDYEDPKPEPRQVNYIPVKWIKAHGYFAYSAGDEGIVDETRIPELLEGGFIQLIKPEQKRSFLDKLKSKKQ